MGLSLVVGPAHAGKVELLLDRFVEAIERDPWLIVPNRTDVEPLERELIARCGGLLAGTVGTFDTLFEVLAHGDGDGKRLLGDAERTVLLRELADAAQGDGARFSGFAEAAGRALAELDGALLEPDDLVEPLASLARAYRGRLAGLDAWDRGSLRRRAIERLTGELDAWGASPVFAHGFEDLTGAEWRLLEALSARADVHVSLPYEPGRAVYASLRRTVGDLSALAGDAVVELPPRSGEFLPAGLAHVERALFDDSPRARAARRLDPVPGGSGGARHVRAGRGGGARPDPRRHAAFRDRGRLSFGRRGQARAGCRVRGPRRARGLRRSGPPSNDAVRACASLLAPLRLARRRAAGAVRAPPVAVLRAPAKGRRLDRGPPAWQGNPPRRPGDRGHRPAPRREVAPAARSRPRRRPADGRGSQAGGRDARGRPTARRRRLSGPVPGRICRRTTLSRGRWTSSTPCRPAGTRSPGGTCSRRSSARACAESRRVHLAGSRFST